MNASSFPVITGKRKVRTVSPETVSEDKDDQEPPAKKSRFKKISRFECNACEGPINLKWARRLERWPKRCESCAKEYKRNWEKKPPSEKTARKARDDKCCCIECKEPFDLNWAESLKRWPIRCHGCEPKYRNELRSARYAAQALNAPICERIYEEELRRKVEAERIEKWKDYPMKDIDQPHDNDVLCRSGETKHPGNKQLHKTVRDRMNDYNSKGNQKDRRKVRLDVLHDLRSREPPVRFLKMDETTKLWHDIGDKEADVKISKTIYNFNTIGRSRSGKGKNGEANEGVVLQGSDEAEADRMEKWKDYPLNYPLKDIDKPHDNDVLCGTGGGETRYSHAGNMRFMAMVIGRRDEYAKVRRNEKAKIYLDIIRTLKNQEPPTRFLKMDETTKLWHDIGEEQTRDQTKRALRHKIPQYYKAAIVERMDDDPEEELRRKVEAENKSVSVGVVDSVDSNILSNEGVVESIPDDDNGNDCEKPVEPVEV